MTTFHRHGLTEEAVEALIDQVCQRLRLPIMHGQFNDPVGLKNSSTSSAKPFVRWEEGLWGAELLVRVTWDHVS